MEETRVDRWLWAVRIYKTRSMATDACKGGHVRVNGRVAKPAHPVRPGDRVSTFAGRERVLEVVTAIQDRVGAPLAAECLIDHSPPPPPKEERPPNRDPGMGRPTKRDRRGLDRLRGR